MKLVVFGSTGGIGFNVVQQALAAGYQVTAVARNPSAITLRHENLEIARGDVLDAQTVCNLVAGKDAVVAALGARDRKPTTVYSHGNANIIKAMQAADVHRLFCVSAAGLDPGPLWQRLIARPILWLVLKESYTDLVRMENLVSRSPVDWTILRPPQLTDGPRTGRYQVGVNKHLSPGRSISRADLADYIINHLFDPASYRAWVEVAY